MEKKRAFTLIELLVVTLIVFIMLGVAFTVFGQVQRGTRVSLASAQLSVTAQGADARLRTDALGMVGPSSLPGAAAGCLVIVPGVREGYLPLPGGRMSPNKIRLRSDQLVFISQMDGKSNNWLTRNSPLVRQWTSLIPPDGNDPANKVTSFEGRIWYGAVKDATVPAGDGTSDDISLWAHRWPMGRQCKLIGRLKDDGTGTGHLVPDPAHAASLGDPGITPDNDTMDGSLALLADTACGVQTLPGGSSRRGVTKRALGTSSGSDWQNADYLKKFACNPDDATTGSIRGNITNLPALSAKVDLHALRLLPPNPTADVGLQCSDWTSSHMLLFEGCSEIIVQWAGDLDKDGRIDAYPPGHPLAGSIIWYPEEYHDRGAWYNANAAPRLAGWNNSPKTDLGAKYQAMLDNPWTKAFPAGFTTSADRFGGRPFPKGFQFSYGEEDNGSGQTTHDAEWNVPDAFVFRFEDDQYRLVRFGFRQDGSVYANKHDGFKPLPGPIPKGTAANQAHHWFPYPPSGTVAAPAPNPSPATLYAGIPAADGPWPHTATTAVPVTAAIASNYYSGPNFGDGMGDTPLPPGSYRTPNNTPDATHPNGMRLTVSQTGEILDTPANATGSETIWTSASDPYTLQSSDWGQKGTYLGQTVLGNNHTVNYKDLWAEYLEPINNPAKQGTLADWRNPQSDWPRLIRIRFRLHDAQGLVTSSSDEALMNGRDDDGDGTVDKPGESAISGIWFEHIIAVPYPMNPTPRNNGIGP